MSRTRERGQAGFIRPQSPPRTLAGHEARKNRADAYNSEQTYMRTLILYAMR